jgi:hypothetical protein
MCKILRVETVRSALSEWLLVVGNGGSMEAGLQPDKFISMHGMPIDPIGLKEDDIRRCLFDSSLDMMLEIQQNAWIYI